MWYFFLFRVQSPSLTIISRAKKNVTQKKKCITVWQTYFFGNLGACWIEIKASTFWERRRCFSFFFFLHTFQLGTEVTVHTEITVYALFYTVYILFTNFSTNFSLKWDLMALFTYLKIILLQYFQFSAKISYIQMDL